MALTKFVRNVTDISDDGGFKFRFHCDRCNDGVESQYVSSSSNLLKTGLEIFNMFRPMGSIGRHAVQGVDRGLRGKERDAAYERAVNEASTHFHKCSHCGNYVCPHCWNSHVAMCEGCAPDADEAAAKQAAKNALNQRVAGLGDKASHAMITCAVCSQEAGGGRFCQSCGASVAAQRTCNNCNTQLAPTAKFCGDCGTRC